MTEETKHSSFAVALIPEFDDNNEWTGSVVTHVEEEVFDDLDEDQLTQIRSVCGMMAACLPLMEQDEEFLDYVRDFFLTNYQDMIAEILEDVEDKPSFVRSPDGKVITLNFNTKTHGSA